MLKKNERVFLLNQQTTNPQLIYVIKHFQGFKKAALLHILECQNMFLDNNLLKYKILKCTSHGPYGLCSHRPSLRDKIAYWYEELWHYTDLSVLIWCSSILRRKTLDFWRSMLLSKWSMPGTSISDPPSYIPYGIFYIPYSIISRITVEAKLKWNIPYSIFTQTSIEADLKWNILYSKMYNFFVEANIFWNIPVSTIFQVFENSRWSGILTEYSGIFQFNVENYKVLKRI